MTLLNVWVATHESQHSEKQIFLAKLEDVARVGNQKVVQPHVARLQEAIGDGSVELVEHLDAETLIVLQQTGTFFAQMYFSVDISNPTHNNCTKLVIENKKRLNKNTKYKD